MNHLPLPPTPLIRLLDRLHLAYLALLPLAATFALITAYGTSIPFLVFLIGAGTIGIYLAVIASYTPIPRTPMMGLLVILDGPFWVGLSALIGDNQSSAFIESFLIDSLAITLSILFISILSNLPTRGQRIASIFIGLAASGFVLGISWPYLQADVFPSLIRSILLLAGCLQALILRHKMLRDENVQRAEVNPAFLGGIVLAWSLIFSLAVAIWQNGSAL